MTKDCNNDQDCNSDQDCNNDQDHGGDEFKEDERIEGQKKDTKGENGKLTEKEKEEVGSVSSSVYLNYFKSVGLNYTLVVLVICIVSNTFNVLSSLWLREWAKDGPGNVTASRTSSLRDQRVPVYGGLTSLEAVTLLLCHFLVKLAALKASNLLHHNLLNHIIHAPMSFFDTTPIGRILNRFTKDLDGLDTYIVYYIKFTLFSSFKVLSHDNHHITPSTVFLNLSHSTFYNLSLDSKVLHLNFTTTE